MKKSFSMENDIGLLVKYTVLGITSIDEKYVIYTDYFPSENELGIRLYAGLLIDENEFKIKKIQGVKEKELTDAFAAEVVSSGRKVRRVIS